MYLRTATSASSQSQLGYIYQNRNNFTELSNQISSGKKLLKPSDDAAGAVSVLNVNKELNQLQSYIKNIESGKNELGVLDSTLAQANKSLQRAYDLAVTASNGTNSPDALKAAKTEIDQIINNLKDLGNTKYNGKYIFAGTNTTTAPFVDRPGGGGVEYTGTPATSDYERNIEISNGVKETVNTTGDRLFGSYDAAAGTGSGIFESLYTLSNALGQDPPNYDDIRAGIDTTLKGTQTISDTRTNFAAITNRFNMTKTSIESNVLQLTSFKSSIEDVDYSTAITNLAMSQYALQATMSVAAQNNQISLLNFM